MVTGTLHGVGVGPGDPDLITLKAWKLIANAPVIAYLAANGQDSTARDIAMPPKGSVDSSTSGTRF